MTQSSARVTSDTTARLVEHRFRKSAQWRNERRKLDTILAYYPKFPGGYFLDLAASEVV